MGHYVLHHIVWSLLMTALLVLVTLFLAARSSVWVLARWGDRFGFHELTDPASLPLVLLLGSLFVFAVQPAFLAYSRMNEHDADRFGLEITHDNHAAATAFVKLQTENLSIPWPSALEKWWKYSHPPLGERIEFCNDYHPWR
jgi:Zn-dependent protease with chaperone function